MTQGVPVAAETAAPRMFYVWMSAACLAIAVFGFMPSYFVPMSKGTFHGEPIVHIHGLIMFSWVLFALIQSLLVARGKVVSHRTWGVLGVSIYTAMVFIIMAVVSLRIAQASLPGQPEGLAHAMRAFEWISVGALVIGIPTFVLAIAYVRRPEIHKRLMLLVTVGLTGWRPIARWFLFLLGRPPVLNASPLAGGTAAPHRTAGLRRYSAIAGR